MIEKKIAVDQIEIVGPLSFIQVRTATRVMDDGVEIAKTYHRQVVYPGDVYAGEDPRVAAICQLLHTPEVIAAHQLELSKQERNEQ